MNNTMHKLSILVFFTLVMIFIANLPYFNLFITPFFIIISVWFLVELIIKPSGKYNIAIGILVILLSLPWVLVGNRVGVENLGVFAFLSILLGIIQESIILIKDNGNTK